MVDGIETLIRRKDIAEALEVPGSRVPYLLKAYKIKPAKIEGSSRKSYFRLSEIEGLRDKLRTFR